VSDALDFMNALAHGVPDSERLIFCGFVGDPNTASPTAWKPRAWRSGESLPLNPNMTNGYIAISSFKRSPDKSWRRRNDLFGHGLAVMVDDVGTKIDPSIVEHTTPSAIIETSPANYQWWYLLNATADKPRFDATIKAFIAQKLMGEDSGMNGVNRVGRIPAYINGKAKYAGFRVKLCDGHDLSLRYGLDDIKDMFSLRLKPMRRRRKHAPPDARDRISLFMHHYNWLKHSGQLKHDRPNAGGWIEMECPWIHEHTAKANTGAAMSMPSEENEWYGAYQCHHGHCIDRTWGSLTDWMNDINVEECDKANANDRAFLAMLRRTKDE